MNFYVDMAISVLLALLSKTIPKDGSSKKEWKKAFLKVFKAIGAAYSDDPDFSAAAKEWKS